MTKVVSLSLILFLVAGCSTSSEKSPPPWHNIDLSFEHVARLVSTDYDYGFHVDAVETPEGPIYIYNDEIRAPESPVGPLPVDCDETKQIGVWLTPHPDEKKQRGLYRQVRIYAKEPKVEIQWEHSERPAGDSRYYWKRGFSFGYRFITRLNLAKEDRIDGVMTLKIHRGEEVLHQTSFQLMGCGLR